MINVWEEKSEALRIKSMLCQRSVKQEKFHPLASCADRGFRTTRNPRHLTRHTAMPLKIEFSPIPASSAIPRSGFDGSSAENGWQQAASELQSSGP